VKLLYATEQQQQREGARAAVQSVRILSVGKPWGCSAPERGLRSEPPSSPFLLLPSREVVWVRAVHPPPRSQPGEGASSSGSSAGRAAAPPDASSPGLRRADERLQRSVWREGRFFSICPPSRLYFLINHSLRHQEN